MSTTASAGLCSPIARRRPIGVADRGGHVVPCVLEEANEPLAQERLILGDHDPHGSSATTSVPCPGGLAIVTFPPSAATRSAMPERPDPSEGLRPADAVVADRDDEGAVLPLRR